MNIKPITKTEDKIGRHIANLVDDGATLQMGIGGIPNAALSHFDNQNTMMFPIFPSLWDFYGSEIFTLQSRAT